MELNEIDKEMEDRIFNFISSSIEDKDFQVQSLAGDASNRRYYRVIKKDVSYVLMVWEPFTDDKNYPFLSVLNHFHNNGVHVPEVINKSPELGFILLEDLGDLTLERKFWENQDQANSFPFYQQAIDELIKIHYTCSQTPNQCTAFKIAFDTDKFLWELNYGKKHLLEDVLKIKLSDKVNKEMNGIFLEISKTLDQQEKFISHRDYHSRNLMMKLGKMRVIDFQDARLGPIQYDLVSLINDSYVNIKDELAQQILNDYVDKANEQRAKKISTDEFNEIYQVQKIQRCFKACGSFASFLNLRDDRRYLKYLKPTLNTVYKTLDQFPQYKSFQNLLEDHDVLNKDYMNL